MEYLPVHYSIVNPNALEVFITQHYGWSNVRVQLIKATMRDVYEVWADGQHAILCLYRHGERTATEIEAEMMIMRHLHQQDIAVPLPIAQQNDALVFTLSQPEGVRHGVMITYIEGTPIGRQLTSDTGEQVGTLLARTHRALDSLPFNMARPIMDYDGAMQHAIAAFERAAPQRSDNIRHLREIEAHLSTEVNSLLINGTEMRMKHGDIIPSNILRQESGLALLDFDLCAYGLQRYDVASFLVEIAYWNMGDAVRAAFLNGYQSQHPLTQQERATLPVLQALRGLISLGTPARFINSWGRVYFADAIIDKQLALIDEALQ